MMNKIKNLYNELKDESSALRYWLELTTYNGIVIMVMFSLCVYLYNY